MLKTHMAACLVATALIAAPATAQTPTPLPASPTPAAPAMRNVSKADFVNQAAMSGMFEVQSSELALNKSQDVRIRDFAQHMVQDHTQASEKLKAAAQGTSVPTNLDQEHAAMLQQLQQASGNDFTRNYTQMQFAGHREGGSALRQLCTERRRPAADAVRAADCADPSQPPSANYPNPPGHARNGPGGPKSSRVARCVSSRKRDRTCGAPRSLPRSMSTMRLARRSATSTRSCWIRVERPRPWSSESAAFSVLGSTTSPCRSALCVGNVCAKRQPQRGCWRNASNRYSCGTLWFACRRSHHRFDDRHRGHQQPGLSRSCGAAQCVERSAEERTSVSLWQQSLTC